MNQFEAAKGHFLSGLSLFERQDYAAAEAQFRHALALVPDRVSVLSNLSGTLVKQGKFAEAEAFAAKAVAIDSQAADAWQTLGTCLHALNRLDEALASYDRAIKLKPEHAGTYNSRGHALQSQKRFEEALASYDEAIKRKPDFAGAYNDRGNTLQELKRFDEALASYAAAIRLEPANSSAFYNRGFVLRALNRLDEALASYDEAIKLNPDHADAYGNRGNVLQDLKRFDDALASYDAAIRLEPDHADAWNNRGNALHGLRRYDEALASYENAIRRKPDFADAYNNRGHTHLELDRLDEALDNYERAIGIRPDHDFWSGNWLHTKLKLCDWSEAESRIAELAGKIERGIHATPPFPVLALADSAALQRKAAQIWVDDKHPVTEALPGLAKRAWRRKIRIGYYSADFRSHATAYLMAGLFERHDREKYELVAFSFGRDENDEMSERLGAAFDQFVDVRHQSDKDVALLSRRIEIDIAVDLKGYTRDARVGIFSCRAAPLQVNYLGYPGTMAAEYIDYLIADSTLIPEASRQHYAEKIAYLPHSYQVNDRERQISGRIFTREELGLPQSGFVFCCFNNSYKITPATFDGWMRILAQVGGSVLWLLEDNRTAMRNLRKAAEARGVSAGRIVFGKRLPVAEHLARQRAADLFVDTLPCNAHTTASDALWAGLPLLTLAGESFAARVAASLLKAVDLPELIATTQAQYEGLAVELATSPERLAQITQKLARNRLTTPLFDTELFTRHLEDAYAQMYERYLADLPPAHLYVTERPAK